MEPPGGAHRDKDQILLNVKESLIKSLSDFESMSGEEIFNDRKKKFLNIGRNKGFVTNTGDTSSLKAPQNEIIKILYSKKLILTSLAILILILLLIIS